MARRTNAVIDHIKRSIYYLCQAYQPMTVRQLFYALTTEGVIDKTEQEYKYTVCRLTKLMRQHVDRSDDPMMSPQAIRALRLSQSRTTAQGLND